MMSSSPCRAVVQLVAVLAMAPHLSAGEFSYEEIGTLNVSLEPSPEHFLRGDGFLYGASRDKIGGNGGMIYRLAPGQPVEVLHEFEAPTEMPMENDGGAGIALIKAVGPDGALYGTTQTGGPEGTGVLFRYAIDGTFSIIDAPKFRGMPRPTDLVVVASGDIYGVAETDPGDTNGSNNYGGSLFRRAADGAITILHTFTQPSSVPGGGNPGPPTVPLEPYAPYRLCEGPDGKLYGVTFSGGAGRGVFFSYDLGTSTFAVLASVDYDSGWMREMAPTEGGFHVLTETHLYHMAYDGTMKVEVKAADLPNPTYGFNTVIVETEDGTFLNASAGGANGAGFLVRYRPGEGASVVYDFPSDPSVKARVITAGPDGKVCGVAGYPADYSPPEEATTATGSTARAAAKKKKKPTLPNPKIFRFRKPGDSPNFPPLARPDSAWLPAKASKTGGREVTVDILANDLDPDRQALTITSVTSNGPASATLVETKKGLRLKVATTEASPASQLVTYQISDGNGGTSTGNVAIYAPLTASFSGSIVPPLPSAPAGSLTVKVSGKNLVTATFTVAGKKFTGRGTFDVDDTSDIQLKLRGQTPIPLRADLVRGGAGPKLQVVLPYSATVYSATLNARGKP